MQLHSSSPWPTGLPHTVLLDSCALRNIQRKLITTFAATQSNLLAPARPDRGKALYGRGTYQLGTLGSHAGFLACRGSIAHSVVRAVAAARSPAARPRAAGLRSDRHWSSGVRFLRGHPGSLSRYSRPHFTDPRRGILALRSGACRLQRSLLPNSCRTP